MAKSIIVYGPQGCGKSLNAEVLRKAFGLDRVHDEYPLGINKSEFETQGVLYLTNQIPDWLLPSEAKTLCMPYGEALEHVEAYKARTARQDPVMKLSGPALKIKRLHQDAIIPQYQTAGAACFDLHAVLDRDTQVGFVCPQGHTPVRTGLAFEIPPGFVMLVFSRSGHGFKHGVRLANCTGVIDSDFRGEVLVSLYSDRVNNELFEFKTGDRIAQAMLVNINRWQLQEVDELSETVRGANGGGSTGV